MNYKQFMDNVKSKKLKSVYLFYGEEVYLMDFAIQKLKETFISEPLETMNYKVLEGENIDFDKIFNACETLPFMSDKKIVIVKEFPLLKTNKKDLQIAENKNGENLADYLLKLDNYIVLIFVIRDKDIKKSNSIYKAIKKAGDIVEFKRLKGRDLNLWVKSRFKIKNRKISKENVKYIIQQSLYYDSNSKKTLYDLENEIIKICNYVDADTEITKDIIDNVMVRTFDMNVFNLLNEISNKKGEKAVRLFDEMYMSNKPVLFILHMIIRQLRNMLNYKIIKAKGYSEKETFIKMKLSEFEFKKVANQSNNFTVDQLEKAMKYCLEADESIKMSSVDEKLAVEMLIAKLCYKI